jgi:hypothetical protein
MSFTGQHLTEEHRRKLSVAHKGKPHPHVGHPISEETRRKISEANLGKPGTNLGIHFSPEWRQHISEALKEKPRPWLRGRPSGMTGKHHPLQSKVKISEALKGKRAWDNRGENNPLWKGDEAGYSALHQWVKSHLVKPRLCQKCGEEKPLDLSNISGKYRRDLSDWQWLCRSCHIKYDGSKP